jgi:3-phosphoshikimate 1-carboxyvinyltransferase
MDITIESAGRLEGSIRVPGDKSIAHRALILGALAQGSQTVSGLPASEDLESTRSCLETLGIRFEESAGTLEIIPGEWKNDAILYAGNSGTSARLLSGLVAGLGLHATLDGDASLRKRPMKRIAEPLAAMGAKVRTTEGCLPMEIRGGTLGGRVHEPEAASAQVKSAILIAGLFASGETTVIEKACTRDHTEKMLSAMGVEVRVQGRKVSLSPGRPEGIHVDVAGDISSALFFIVAAALMPGSEVHLPGVGVNPTRTGALTALERMGMKIERENERIQAGEPVADLAVRHQPLRGARINGDLIPLLIDELPVIAVAASMAEGVTEVRDAQELRYKESDRIETVVRNLSRLGADIEARPDGFVVRGPSALKGGTVSSFGDHRVAMAMAVTGLAAAGAVTIKDAEAASVSYPEFFNDLEALR